jgi:hypothetical protein
MIFRSNQAGSCLGWIESGISREWERMGSEDRRMGMGRWGGDGDGEMGRRWGWGGWGRTKVNFRIIKILH